MLQAKWIGICLLVIGVIIYWSSLITTIETQKTEISQLSAAITIQNNAIDVASKERDRLQNEINVTIEKNEKINAENKKLKNDINHRPASNNCEEAFAYLTNTAREVAKEFNK